MNTEIAEKVRRRDDLSRKSIKDAATPMNGGAYREGYEAARQKGDLSDNPYPEGVSTSMGIAHDYWELGFMHCCIDIASAKRSEYGLPETSKICNVYDLLMSNDEATWRWKITTMIEECRQEPEKGPAKLRQEISSSFPRLLLKPFSIKSIILWRDIWKRLADAYFYTELELPILILDVFTRYQEKPDVRLILTELRAEMRPFLTQLLDL